MGPSALFFLKFVIVYEKKGIEYLAVLGFLRNFAAK